MEYPSETNHIPPASWQVFYLALAPTGIFQPVVR
ncbi:hypothetical protein GGC65_004298 [Sphingopyxis sp. OAS728]|nr:hypothetical protein [Sphingopyxis sp. OAS728]